MNYLADSQRSVGDSVYGPKADAPFNLTSAIIGSLALISLGVVSILGFAVTGPDRVQGEYVRLIYIHPAAAWVSYLAFGVTAAFSAAYLFPRTRRIQWDRIAGASAEVGVIFCIITLVTGSIWGRPTWGVWWTWDARLTSTAVMLAVELGYLGFRRAEGNPGSREKRNSIIGLLAFINVPIVHKSVEWWRTLHQGKSLLSPDPEIDGVQLSAMLLSIVAYSLVYLWMTMKRFQIETDSAHLEGIDISQSVLTQRQLATIDLVALEKEGTKS